MLIRRLWLLLLTGVCGVLSGGVICKAASRPPRSEIGFNVAAKPPANQMNQRESFFDLKMHAGQAETIQTTIYNTTDHEITVEQALHTMYTNANGGFDYVTPAKTYDPSLKYKLSELGQIHDSHRVTIPAYATKVVTATLNMPSNHFNGVMLGSWYFKRINDKVTGQVEGVTSVRSEYSYSIGIKCTLGVVPKPQMQLGTVKAGLYNHRRGILMNVRNVSAVIIPNLFLKGTIRTRDGNKVVQNISQQNVQMAPNSGYPDPLLLGKQPLKAGRYHLDLVASNAKHRWHFERDFSITAAQVRKINNRAVDYRSSNPWWLILVGAVGAVLIILLGWGLRAWWRHRKNRATKVE